MKKQSHETEQRLPLGFGEVPFPKGRKTDALRKEDAYMEKYGDDRCSACGFIEKAFWESGLFFIGVVRRILNSRNARVRRRVQIRRKKAL
ncbi:hypothetical protein [Saccharospirillum impatiens]|uniref:hypothetical protein n=1 Tax=Saccharospirillum impatiens TaxID=169438 RepID=UPI00040AC60E|nr:hypothetical protein [Saccharospirillum impatiens]